MTSLFRMLGMWVVLATFGLAAEEDWVGKTVVIKTSKEGSQGITIKGDVLEPGSVGKAGAAAASFKVLAGSAPGNVMFESVSQPEKFLHHFGGNFVLLPKAGGDAQWRLAAPLQGKQGVSLENAMIPGKFLTEKAKGEGWHVTEKIERKREAVFFLEVAP